MIVVLQFLAVMGFVAALIMGCVMIFEEDNEFDDTTDKDIFSEIANRPTYKDKIQDLVESLEISNIKWNDWETGFILGLQTKLVFNEPYLSLKQRDVIDRLWDKI